MLKVRLMGTKGYIRWFKKILQNNSCLEIQEFSAMYPIKGSNRHYRVYVEIEKIEKEEKENHHV